MKFICPVCGYVEEFDGDELPADFVCPICKVPASKFIKQAEGDGELSWASEHVVGVGMLPEVPAELQEFIRAEYNGECSEAGMYLAMARVAYREGYVTENWIEAADGTLSDGSAQSAPPTETAEREANEEDSALSGSPEDAASPQP